jgi:hypothetical protein
VRHQVNSEPSDVNDETSQWPDDIVPMADDNSDLSGDYFASELSDNLDRESLIRLLFAIQHRLLSSNAPKRADRPKRPSWAKTRRLNKKNY